MWFGVAPVTPPHVRRRTERYQQEHTEAQPSAGVSGAALCSPRGRGAAFASPSSPCPSPSLTPRAGALPLVTSRRVTGESASELRALHMSPRGRDSASDGRDDDRARGRRRLRVPAQSPRHNVPAPQSTSEHDQQQKEEETPESALTRGPGKSRGRRRSVADNAGNDACNQRGARETTYDDSEWTGKEQSERKSEAVASRPTTRSSSTASSTTRPRQESPNPAMPRSRRASRHLSRSDVATMASPTPDAPTIPHSGLLLPFLSRIGERFSFSRAGASTASAATNTTQPDNLVGHASSVCALAASDDRVLVSGSRDGLVKIWSRVTFASLQTLSGHDDNVSCVDIQGDWLISGSHDATLRLYHRRRRRSLLNAGENHAGGSEFDLHCVFRGHTGHVTKVQLLPETLPGLALSCSDDATLRLWSAEIAQCVLVLSLHTSRVTCFTVYPIDSRENTTEPGDFLVCSGAADAVVCFWEVLGACRANQQGGEHGSHGDLQVLRSRACHVHRSTVQCVAIVTSEDSATSSSSHMTPLLVSGSNDGTIQLFNLLAFEHLALLHDCQAPVYALAVASSGRLVSATRDGRLLVFSDVLGFFTSATRGRSPMELKVAPTWLSSLQLRGDFVACCGEDTLYIASVSGSGGSVLRAIETKHGFINCVRWIHSCAVVTCGQDNVVKMWNTVS